MSHETIGYVSETLPQPNGVKAEMPEVRKEPNKLINNLAPGQLPTEVDLALSEAVIYRLSK